jgi:phage shock protein A
MKAFLYWIVGDRTGRTLTATWNWLWGKPIENGGKIAVEVAQESLSAMQQSVYKLTESVAKVIAAHEKAKKLYQLKQEEVNRSEAQAALAQTQGNIEAAHLAMAKVIEIERILPNFAAQVQQAETARNQLNAKLTQERQKLESYKVQMQNLSALAEVNEALACIDQINSDLNLNSASNQFSAAQNAIENRHRQSIAMAELSENPMHKLQGELDQMTLEDEINHRLKRLNSTSINS